MDWNEVLVLCKRWFLDLTRLTAKYFLRRLIINIYSFLYLLDNFLARYFIKKKDSFLNKSLQEMIKEVKCYLYSAHTLILLLFIIFSHFTRFNTQMIYCTNKVLIIMITYGNVTEYEINIRNKNTNKFQIKIKTWIFNMKVYFIT